MGTASTLEPYLGHVALSLTPGLGARTAGKLLLEFGSPENIFRASLTKLESLHLTAPTAQAIFSKKPLQDAEKELLEAEKLGVKLMQWDEPDYPRRLREIYDPPPLLYIRGDASLLGRHILSVVGTRRPTPYGNQMAERLSRDLAERGLVIASGLARGVDSSAHKGALAAKAGTTIAVLGNGIDVVYPKENRKLYEQIAERGALVTEFPLKTFPGAQNFPIRNRIVAGMGLGVVIVEGAQYSGSLITARLAMEFGREVYGVPGNATTPVSFAPNHLIKQGAKLTVNWEDVVQEFPTEIRAELTPVESPGAEERATLIEQSLNTVEKKLYSLLHADRSRHVDELVEESALNSSVILPALFEMEMKGVVRQLPGKQFIRVFL